MNCTTNRNELADDDRSREGGSSHTSHVGWRARLTGESSLCLVSTCKWLRNKKFVLLCCSVNERAKITRVVKNSAHETHSFMMRDKNAILSLNFTLRWCYLRNSQKCTATSERESEKKMKKFLRAWKLSIIEFPPEVSSCMEFHVWSWCWYTHTIMLLTLMKMKLVNKNKSNKMVESDDSLIDTRELNIYFSR